MLINFGNVFISQFFRLVEASAGSDLVIQIKELHSFIILLGCSIAIVCIRDEFTQCLYSYLDCFLIQGYPVIVDIDTLIMVEGKPDSVVKILYRQDIFALAA